tara:strand:- start:90 stop:998 length:909 start_codon:yes stop_codon:yes gene_type:complete
MDREDLGLKAAAKRAKTTPRTLKQYFKDVGIKIRRQGTGQYRLVLPPKQLREKFLRRMADGDSATKAAKALNTTVRKMRYQRLPSGGKFYPIIRKDPIGKRWEPNFTWVSENSVVVYGYLLGLGDTIQGRDSQMGPNAQANVADPNYADIWWQVDFNSFDSTLKGKSLIEKYKKPIVDLLKRELQTPAVSNAALVALFGTNSKVAAAASAAGRTGNFQLTELENLLERYDIHMDDRMDKINMGVDDSQGTRGEWVLSRNIASGGSRSSDGKFQVMFMRKSGLTTYPSAGPKTVRLNYSLANE